jgi:hypothetical protein
MRLVIILAMAVVLSVPGCGGDSDGEGGPGASPGSEKDAAPPPATEAGKVAVTGKIWSHPLGYRFRYPDGWRLQELGDDMLALVPPDLRRNAQGPTEAFIALGAPAEGVTDPGSPSIASQADLLVRSTFPFLSREGEVEKGRHGGRPSAAITWAGKGPNGDEIRATMWVTVLRDAVLGLAAICPATAFESRRPVIEAVFSTFHWEEPPRDRAMVGLWRHESTYMSGGFSAVTVRHLGLAADGRATWGGKAMAGMSHTDSAGNFTGSSSAESGDGATSQGRWTGANRKLYIVWDSGTEEEYEVYLEGNSMMLTPTGGGKRKVWERVR